MDNLTKFPDFTAHDLLSAYHDGLQQAVEFVQREVVPVLNGQLNLKEMEEAVIGLFYLVHALASSGTRLNNKIDFVAISGNARTVFELLLDLRLLTASDSSSATIAQFRAFAEVDRFKKARRLVDFQSKHPELTDVSILDSKSRKEFVEAAGKADLVEKKVEALWGRDRNGKLRWPEHWSGLGIADRAGKFGPIYEQAYLEVYSLLCSYTHSGNAAYSCLSADALEGFYGIALKLTRDMYIEALLVVAKVIPLPRALEAFPEIVSYLKEAPKHILLEYGLHKMKDTNDTCPA